MGQKPTGVLAHFPSGARRIRYITLPSISFVVIFLLILSLGNILRGEFTEQILLFYSPPVYSIADVMDTWVYRQGLSKIQYSLGSAVSFFQSVFGLDPGAGLQQAGYQGTPEWGCGRVRCSRRPRNTSTST